MYKVLIFMFSLFAVSTHAVVLKVPENFVVISWNDEEQASSFFSRETTLDLSSGDHTLVLKYQDLFDGDDDHTNVKSKPFVVLFSITSEFEGLGNIFVRAELIDDVTQAKAFAKKPSIKLMTETDIEIPSINQSLLAFNSKQRFKEIELTKQPKMPVPTECPINDKIKDLTLLKCMWLQSSDEDKEAFVYFILGQRNNSNK